MAAGKIKLAHPGKILREEFVEPVGLSAYALAKALSIPLPRVNYIVREKRSISPEMAVLLSAYFGPSDRYWINLQAHFDLEMAKDKVGKQAAQINPDPAVFCRKMAAVFGSEVYRKSTDGSGWCFCIQNCHTFSGGQAGLAAVGCPSKPRSYRRGRRRN